MSVCSWDEHHKFNLTCTFLLGKQQLIFVINPFSAGNLYGKNIKHDNYGKAELKNNTWIFCLSSESNFKQWKEP